MKMLLISTVYKSGRRKGQVRKVFDTVAESYGSPRIDFEYGTATIHLKDEKENLFKLSMTPGDVAQFIGAIPIGLFNGMGTDEHAAVIKAIGKIISAFEAKQSLVDKSIH